MVLAAGNYAGVDYYEVTPSGIQPLNSDHYLGAVPDISAAGGEICMIVDGGHAVVRTTRDAAESGRCGRVLYQAKDHSAANGKPLLALHVATSPEGCVVATRNYPRLSLKIMEMVEFLLGLFNNSSPQKIDLRWMEDHLYFLGKDGSFKEIQPVVGNYDRVMFSDLDAFPDGVIASYTAFKKANWDAFSAANWAPLPPKLGLLLKTFSEIRAGGFFIVNGEVRRGTELAGLGGLNIPIWGTVITELPHLSLPYFPEGAVDAKRYALKGMLGFIFFDFTNYSDPNLTSLPMQLYTFSTDPTQPMGLFTDFDLSGDKLFLNGSSSNKVQINYDAASHSVLNAPPRYAPMPSLSNVNFSPVTGLFASGVIRGGFLANITTPAVNAIFYRKPGAPGSVAPYLAGAQLPVSLAPNGYVPLGYPIVWESPAGEAGDKIAWPYLKPDPASGKFQVEVLKADGSLVARTSVEFPLVAGALVGPFYSPGGMTEDLLILGVNDTSGNWQLYAFEFDGQDLRIIPSLVGNPFAQGPGMAMAVRNLQKIADGRYRLVLMVWGNKLIKVEFENNHTNIINTTPTETTITNLRNFVVDEDTAYGIQENGNIIPVELASMTAGASLGSILDDPSHEIILSACGLWNRNVFCSGFFHKKLFQLYEFNLDTKQQTTFPYHRPFGMLGIGSSFVGSKFLLTHVIDGGGVEAFDLEKAHAPKPPLDLSDKTAGPAPDAAPAQPSDANAFRFGGGGGSGCALHKSSE